MLKVIDVTIDYKNEGRELIERLIGQLRHSKRTIFQQSIQWISITTVCFLLIYASGTLALYTLTPPRTEPALSDLHADYGEWTVVLVSRVDPDIVEEIKRDNPQNPEVFTNPKEIDPNDDPFIITQGKEGNEEPPILDIPQPTPTASEPTSTRSPDRSPTPTPTLILTITPTNTPAPTQSPTNTPVLPNPTSPPPPTDQALVTLCHKPGEPNQKTLHVPPADVADHLAHGDYLGECIIP